MSNESPLQRRGMHRRIAARADSNPTSIPEPIIEGPTIGPAAPATDTSTSKPATTSTPATSKSTTPTTTSAPSSDTSTKTSSPTSSAKSSSATSSSPSSSSSSTSASSSSSSSVQSSSTSSTPTSKATTAPLTTPITTHTPLTSQPLEVSSVTPPVSLASYAATPSASQTVASSGGVSTGTVIGGVAAGVIGIAGIMFAVFYFLKRGNRDDDDMEDFNAMAFKRQSIMLPDDDTLSRGPSMRSNGYNNTISMPPPSMMSEMGQPSPTFAASGPYFHNFAPQPSFGPGQYMNAPPMQGFPNTPNSANPFLDRYGAPPSPYTPANGYRAQGQPPLARQPSGGAQVLTRQPPMGANTTLADPNAHYVDLQRSSVTPFQAAQYAEISARLGSEPPASLPEPDAQEIAQRAMDRSDSLPSYSEGEHSFTPGRYEKPLPAPEPEVLHEEPEELIDVEDNTNAPGPHTPDLTLPSPAFSAAGHTRIPSKPPMLPEISARPFSPVTVAHFATPSPVQSPLSTFTPVSPPPPAHFAGAPSAVAAAVPRAGAGKGATDPSKRDTTYTIYDEEDAYGGI